MRFILRAAPLAALALWACSDSPSSPAVSRLELVAGAAIADTVDAEPPIALEVHVGGVGRRDRPGVEVRFESVVVHRSIDGEANPLPTALVAAPGGAFAALASVTTDAAGRASVRVKLGALAGEGGIVVAVPSLGLIDTARYTIEPGAAVEFVMGPPDTAVYIGATVTLRAGWVDRHGNLRSDPVSYAMQSSAAQLLDGAITATAHGIAEVVASSGTGTAMARISVVPRGTIAAFYTDPGPSRGITIFGLDGSARRQITTASTVGEPVPEQVPCWSPTGDRLVFHSGGAIAHLYVTTIDGTAEPLPGASSGSLEAEKWPQFSRDGEWVYYSGYQGDFTWSIWRVRADGTGGAERVGPFAVNTQTDAAPTPSPGGDRVIFWTNRFGGQRLALLDVATGMFDEIGLTGSTARWSPLGDRIAYVDAGALRLADPDGGNPSTIAESGFEEWIDWSPDGDWLIAAGQSMLWVIRVADRLMLPIPHAEGMLFPSWRPTED